MDSIIFGDLFREIIRKKHGMEVDFDSIEEKLDHLRGGKSLAYSDLEIIGDEKCWSFKKYWMWPSKDQIEAKLKKTEGWFKTLPEKEEEIIGDLAGIFKNIALVSIILRFVHPTHYAIYSRPPLKILRIDRGFNDVEEYLNYVQLLRLLKHSFGVTKTADVDMIVWAIVYEKGEYLKKLKKMIAEQLPEKLSPEELMIFLSDNPLKIAEAYYGKKDIKTAGLWAAIAFEKFIRFEYVSFFGFRYERKNGEIVSKVRLLCNTKKFRYESQKLHKLRELRNSAVHESSEFKKDDAKYFIDTMKYLKKLR